MLDAVQIRNLIGIYVKILEVALPIALVFGFSNLIVDTILTAAFTGRLRLGGGSR